MRERRGYFENYWEELNKKAANMKAANMKAYMPKQYDDLCWKGSWLKYSLQRLGYWGRNNEWLAMDTSISPGNTGFYHSNQEPYPALTITLRTISQRTVDNSSFQKRKPKVAAS